MSLEGFKRAFGIKKKVKPEDMKKRITEKSYAGPNVKPSKKEYEAETRPYKPNTVKVTKKETSVETPTGNIGSVDRTSDVIGPDMGRVNRSSSDEGAPVRDLSSRASDEDIARIAAQKGSSYTYDDPMDAARNLLSPKPLGYKRGGAVKKKSGGCGMKSGGSVRSGASKRADGCAVRGKTRGRMV